MNWSELKSMITPSLDQNTGIPIGSGVRVLACFVSAVSLGYYWKCNTNLSHPVLLGNGFSNLCGISYDDQNSTNTPWVVKYQGKTKKCFPTKRQAADFYLQLSRTHQVTMGSFTCDYAPCEIDLTVD